MEEVAATIDVSDAAAMLGADATADDAPVPLQEFKWTRESCLLLLHEYELLKDKFKDRKNKKKDLWAEISMKFKKIYACDLEWDVAYKKFRNLKQTFEQVRVKLNQQAVLGQVSNRPKWPYYDKFVQILDDSAPSYSYTEQHQLPVEHHLQQHQEQLDHHSQMVEHHQQIVEAVEHHHHHHLQAHHHHHQQQHQQQQQLLQQHQQQQQHLDPGSVGQMIAGEEEFTETLVTAFPMGEELEIPSHPPEDTPPDVISKTEEEEIVGQMPAAEEEYAEEEEEPEEEVVQDEMEPPHRKRYRRRTSYQQERLEIEREKLHTLREIQRGIECKNDILQGILHVLQAKVWQAHPTE
ncbi:probable serine/threonine-protein kinase DDB_G0280133 [Anopheles ziemanni]|uniref:probable serine/threonine-protein kinase DDB_G0280133 n=1 Tax=Anopheles coustani TaxID=139045 RepID=UPI002659979A|nr:probable serine/threonine-protein kinase DDB_G0280133 [Anopheles coustani]XP_058179049.1 probable serine/threonine-protein kinase DDB_G0280133 [Anopheles ziemanni]